MSETVHCCLCRADHPIEEGPFGKQIVCPSAPGNTLYFLNTKYFTQLECTCTTP